LEVSYWSRQPGWFGGVAEDLVTGDPLTVVDAVISEWFRLHATPSLTAQMVIVSGLASTPAVVLACLAATALLLWKRKWFELLALALVVPGGLAINRLLKMAFARARRGWGVDFLGYSFPSGHTMTATLIYGLLAVFCVGFVAKS